jgi:hypothetical protein
MDKYKNKFFKYKKKNLNFNGGEIIVKNSEGGDSVMNVLDFFKIMEDSAYISSIDMINSITQINKSHISDVFKNITEIIDTEKNSIYNDKYYQKFRNFFDLDYSDGEIRKNLPYTFEKNFTNEENKIIENTDGYLSATSLDVKYVNFVIDQNIPTAPTINLFLPSSLDALDLTQINNFFAKCKKCDVAYTGGEMFYKNTTNISKYIDDDEQNFIIINDKTKIHVAKRILIYDNEIFPIIVDTFRDNKISGKIFPKPLSSISLKNKDYNSSMIEYFKLISNCIYDINKNDDDPEFIKKISELEIAPNNHTSTISEKLMLRLFPYEFYHIHVNSIPNESNAFLLLIHGKTENTWMENKTVKFDNEYVGLYSYDYLTSNINFIRRIHNYFVYIQFDDTFSNIIHNKVYRFNYAEMETFNSYFRNIGVENIYSERIFNMNWNIKQPNVLFNENYEKSYISSIFNTPDGLSL